MSSRAKKSFKTNLAEVLKNRRILATYTATIQPDGKLYYYGKCGKIVSLETVESQYRTAICTVSEKGEAIGNYIFNR